MAFRLVWGAPSHLTTTTLFVGAEGLGPTFPTPRPFASPGLVDYQDIVVPNVINRAFGFRLYLFAGNNRLGVEFHSIGEDDIFSVMAIDTNTFFGGIYHRTAVSATCTVTCPDASTNSYVLYFLAFFRAPATNNE
jgi:hypothetical protein